MVENSTTNLSRRQMLGSMAATAGIAGLSGCFSMDQLGASDVKIYNATTETKSISVTITASDSEKAHTSRSIEVAPTEETNPVNQSKLPFNTDYTIDVDVEDGPSEIFEWKDPTVERAPLLVFIDGSRNIKFLLQAG